MTLYQISFTYRADAAVLRTRISELRAAARAAARSSEMRVRSTAASARYVKDIWYSVTLPPPFRTQSHRAQAPRERRPESNPRRRSAR